MEDGQRVTVTLYGKNYDAVVSANAWSASIPVAAAVLPDDGYRVTASVSNKAGIPAPPDTQTLKRPENHLPLTPGQARELKRKLADEKLILIEAAVELIRRRTGGTDGYARKLWKDARVSGAVLFVNDYACRKNDLEGWLDRHAPQTSKLATPQKTKAHQYRNPSDAALIKKGRRWVAKGMSKLAAATQLAQDATGGNLEQRIERLRKLLKPSAK